MIVWLYLTRALYGQDKPHNIRQWLYGGYVWNQVVGPLSQSLASHDLTSRMISRGHMWCCMLNRGLGLSPSPFPPSIIYISTLYKLNYICLNK
jgi:hypothetical protein